MKQFIAFVRKEFHHIWRDKSTLFILLGMPIVEIIIFGFALTNEVKNSLGTATYSISGCTNNSGNVAAAIAVYNCCVGRRTIFGISYGYIISS